MKSENRSLLPGSLLAAACALAGCSTRTYIAATGSTPPQFTHVFITTQEVWLNESATATPEDSGWVKNTLKTAVTVDLVTAANGTLEQLIGGLKLSPGTYKQIQLIPIAYSPTAGEVALAAGATYDQEVDFVDATGTAHQMPLQIPNPDKGIRLSGSVKVPVGALSTTTSSSSSSSSSDVVNFAVTFDAAQDVALFTYGPDSTYGAVLSPHGQAYDLSEVGGISGTLSVTTPNNYTNVSARLSVTATAEQLSSDGSRHVPVLSAPVAASGAFMLYPLAATDDTDNPTTYDVVIHGAGIQTIIIKNVEVTRSSSNSSSSASAATLLSATANTSLGTIVPIAASSYTVGLKSGTTLPPGAIVGFYQTLPTSSSVPYLIETAATDPINHTLALPLPLSSGAVESGTYSTTSTTVTLTSAAPAEGSGVYKVGTYATLFASSDLSGTVSAADASGDEASTTAQVLVSPPAITVESDAISDQLTVAVTADSHVYDAGVLLVTQGGTLIASASLDTVLTAGVGSVTVNTVPGGGSGASFAAARYHLSALLWNTSDPAGLTLQSFADSADLSTGSVTDAQLTIN